MRNFWDGVLLVLLALLLAGVVCAYVFDWKPVW